jgi:hypothetical protein
MLYAYLMAVHNAMDILTSNFMLLVILAASGLTYDFQICILGDMFHGYIGSVPVDSLVSTFLLCAIVSRIRRNARRSAQV